MAPRKRARSEFEPEPETEQHPSSSGPNDSLHTLRNMWEFANLMQYLAMFGAAIKVGHKLSIEEFEQECMHSTGMATRVEIGLGLLKLVSLHKGLSLEIFDEQMRRQYERRLPNCNPFGSDDIPQTFANFDLPTQIQVLHQLSQWTMVHPERVRDHMTETKEAEQTDWRVDPIGWDAKDRTYFFFDDYRLYRQSDTPTAVPPPAQKQKTGRKTAAAAKAIAAAAIASTRNKSRRTKEPTPTNGKAIGTNGKAEANTRAEFKWECIAVSLSDYDAFIQSIKRSRDPNERALYKHCLHNIRPLVEKVDEERRHKMSKKKKELEIADRLANAKRSGRIADRAEQRRKKLEEAEEAAAAAKERWREERKRGKSMQAERASTPPAVVRESNKAAREQRAKEREMKRLLPDDDALRDLGVVANARQPSSPGIAAHAYDIDNPKIMLKIKINEWKMDVVVSLPLRDHVTELHAVGLQVAGAPVTAAAARRAAVSAPGAAPPPLTGGLPLPT
ncbi:MAG: hypothetical protein M1826_000598 [Phylliscum demangeonii]|nr:MAG: hypothetical protein M1826_000598 [Phylliscum demangeonii]